MEISQILDKEAGEDMGNDMSQASMGETKISKQYAADKTWHRKTNTALSETETKATAERGYRLLGCTSASWIKTDFKEHQVSLPSYIFNGKSHRFLGTRYSRVSEKPGADPARSIEPVHYLNSLPRQKIKTLTNKTPSEENIATSLISPWKDVENDL